MTSAIRLDEAATARMVSGLAAGADRPDPAEVARAAARHLGTHHREGRTRFGFWVPDRDPGTPVDLEILLPPDGIDLTAAEQQGRFRVVEVPMTVTSRSRLP